MRSDPGPSADDADRWNHNIHYYRVILSAVPAGASRALDVGCGEGVLTRALARMVDSVVGIDLHEETLARARSVAAGCIDYVHGDFLAYPFESESFDVITSVAAVHHMEFRPAVERMRSLLRPGGVLGLIGLARSRAPLDFLVDAGGAVATRLFGLRRERWVSTAPIIWPATMSYGEVRREAEALLPGVSYRRHLMWRYSLVWAKPAS